MEKQELEALSLQYGVNAEWGSGGAFPRFLARRRGERVLVLCDRNTKPFSGPICTSLAENGCQVDVLFYDEDEPVADEKTVFRAQEAAGQCSYLLAVGAGTLNDVAKYAGFLLGKPSGIYATAPSMDGFTSGVTPLIEGGFKITKQAQVASDVLLDLSLLCHAPKCMTGAGVGDVLAKDCSLADWKLSSLLTGENYSEHAAGLMRCALEGCKAALPALENGEEEGCAALVTALLVSGYAMVEAGNSRPASGAEHHISHYLEMDFLRRGKKIPLHGIKVGLGTMVSLWLYHALEEREDFPKKEEALALAQTLPPVSFVEDALRALSCPTRFSELDIPVDTMRGALEEAYRIRDRFTLLRMYCEKGWMKRVEDELIARFY